MNPLASHKHVFAACQPGFERILKEEVARRHPTLRSAFARPGLVTWVSPETLSDEFELGAIFARVSGHSLGFVDTERELREQIARIGAQRIHVFPREDNPQGWEVANRAQEALTLASKPLMSTDLVVDVIVAPNEKSLVGFHRHSPRHWRHPGGWPRIIVPQDSPSRSYAKIEEAIEWAQLDVRAGQVAIEFGSAPGGAALALVQRGLTVYGIDPAEMSSSVLGFRGTNDAQVHHLRTTLQDVRLDELPAHIDWLLTDVNLAPQVLVHALARFIPRLRRTLRGAILTLKLNDARIRGELPAILERVRGLGFVDVRATHLPSHGHEVACIARL